MSKSLFRLVFAVVTVAGLAGSAALQPKPPTPEYVPQFNYTSEGDPADTTEPFGIVAVIEPAWGKDVDATTAKNEALKAFRSALTTNTYDLLLGKKISVKGPSPAIEEMTFSEKKEAHLALMTDLQFELSCDAKQTNSYQSSSRTYASYAYKTMLKGVVLMKIVEPQSKEMLWQKKLELEEVPFESESGYTNEGSFCYQGFANWPVEHRNALYQNLENQYAVILKKLDTYLSKGELASMAKQAAEIKSKKVY